MMPMTAIVALAVLTYALRLAGPLLRGRVTVPVAASALTSGHGFAGWARPLGVLVAGVLAARRAPFPVVVVAAGGVTALLRLAGVP
jgi:hypothetical protein